jgi:hypothetical protein
MITLQLEGFLSFLLANKCFALNNTGFVLFQLCTDYSRGPLAESREHGNTHLCFHKRRRIS